MKTDPQLKIYVDRLRRGVEEPINESIDATLLDVDESDLSFGPTIGVKGKAYMADDELIVQLDLTAVATLPCAICNTPVEVPVTIKGFLHTAPLSSIPSHVYDLGDVVREAILLSTPQFIECHGGECPMRADLKKFFHTKDKEEAPVQFPFSELDKDDS